MTSQLTNRPIIGIVGGIGSGKTEVSAALAAMGCAVINCDELGHEVLRDASVRQEIFEQWGQAVFSPSGDVDRKALAKFAFASRSELDKLDKIMHPRIRKRIIDDISAVKSDVPAIVLDAAVLFEAQWDDLCTDIVFVDVPQEKRFERVSQNRQWSRNEFLAREKLQIPLDIKVKRCCHVISNSFNISRLHEECSQLLRQITHG